MDDSLTQETRGEFASVYEPADSRSRDASLSPTSDAYRWRLAPSGASIAETDSTPPSEDQAAESATLGTRRVRTEFELHVERLKPKYDSEGMEVLQKWEGYVEQANGETIHATLFDLTEFGGPEEQAEIPMREISIDDHSLVEQGAYFYWCIGYRSSASGQIERVSSIRFKRSARWGRKSLGRLERRTEDWSKLIGELEAGEVGETEER